MESFGTRLRAVAATVLRTAFLRDLLILAVVVTISFPVYYRLFAFPRFDALLVQFVEDDALRLARHLSAPLRETAVPLGRDTLPPGFGAEVELILRDFYLEKVQVFGSDGEIVYSTAATDIGKVNDKPYFHQIVAKGGTYTELVRKEQPSAEGWVVGVDVVETYVPVMHDGVFLGAFELYYDITRRRAELDGLLAASGHQQLLMALLLLGAILIALYIAGRTEQARVVARQALADSEQKFRNMTNSAQDAIVEMDAVGRVSFWNPSAERIFGFTAEEAEGQDLHRLLAPQRFQSAFQGAFKHFRVSGEGDLMGRTTEVVGLHRDGS